MALDLTRVRALCFDVDGTIADTDDHLVAQIAAVLDAVPLVSGRRAERVARQLVMGAETPVNAAYALLDRIGLDVPISRLRSRVRAARQRGADPANTRNIEAADEQPHDMMAGVQEMLVALAALYPMSTISTGTAPRVERFLEHYGVRQHFAAVVGAQTTPRMKPHPDPLLRILVHYGLKPGEALFVGDSAVDSQAAAAAGVPFVAYKADLPGMARIERHEELLSLLSEM